MRRIAILLSLLGLMSCGEQKGTTATGVAAERSGEPIVVSEQEVNQIKNICNALAFKSDFLNDLVGNSYTFSYADKGCAASAMSEARDVKVTLEASADRYIFMQENRTLFQFQNVETPDSGVMKEICQNVGDLKSPILSATGSSATWFTTATSVSDCIPDADHACILIQKGSVKEGTQYTMVSSDWLRIRLTGARRGFFVERKLESSAGCSVGQNLVRKAKLK